MRLFADRADAGRRLAAELRSWATQDVVVAGLPRGGVPVAFEVARSLRAPLDVIVVRKLGVPSHPELAMGALGEGGVRFIDDDVVRGLRVTQCALDAVERHERVELEQRVLMWRGDKPPVMVDGRTLIIVDDGIATGATARVACMVARARAAQRIVVAAPVAALPAVRALQSVADELVCLLAPGYLVSVGQWYADFTPTTDAEVSSLLLRAGERSPT
ncbi:phosphoribosyltransferase [Kibdelosporangium aridum]|uniref:Phosphoribosyltransferase n=1 Tax=Kibdelosporangium aridum TaxID=2030 RepID=A0A428ZB50_KIBAR|nr:phosphoribosyltransferase family protein [Kibdelosporangium aridum]RSM85198.1 phosphoribosyltransferase [Kibdelosporangium aridum]